MALSVYGCGVEVPDETAPSLESSEAELTCQVFQECPDASYVTCMSEGTACLSGTDLGGWVECDLDRAYCVPACICGGPAKPSTSTVLGSDCESTMEQAFMSARSRVDSLCPLNGACSETVQLERCRELSPERFAATVSLRIVCKNPECPY